MARRPVPSIAVPSSKFAFSPVKQTRLTSSTAKSEGISPPEESERTSWGVFSGGPECDESVRFAADEHGIEPYDGRLVCCAAVLEAVKDAGGDTAHCRRCVGSGEELSCRGSVSDLALQRFVEIGGVVLAGLFSGAR